MISNRVKDIHRLRPWISSSFDNPNAASRDTNFEKQVSGKDRGKKKVQATRKKKLALKSNEVLWVEKYKPRKKEDLAVHKKKVAEIEDWMLNYNSELNSVRQKSSVLVLTGPAGVGKTATVHVIAKNLNMEIKEWINPITSLTPLLGNDHENGWKAEPFQSQTSQFWEFLMKANKYSRLTFVGEDVPLKRLILVEDFPNIFLTSPTELHSILRKFNQINQCPIVFIVSDNIKDLNARTLFPEALQQELGITNVSFNLVAPTNLLKVLTAIASTEISPIPSKNTLDSLAQTCSGDIRTAINSLQFSYYKDDLSRKPIRSQSKISKTKRNEVQDEGKDTKLFLFHAIGKILHCKRSLDTQSDLTNLPPHLHGMARPPLISEPEIILNKAAVSGDCLRLFLHQNYLKFFNDIIEVSRAIDYLSDADFLFSEWVGRTTLDECASLVGLRGIMHAHGSTVSAGWQPIHKPFWYSANTQVNERKQSLKYWSKDFNLSNHDLLTQILPYSKFLGQTMWSKGGTNLIRELISFRHCANNRLQEEQFHEKDVVNSEDQQENKQQLSNEQSENPPLSPASLTSNDDFTIEDFSD